MARKRIYSGKTPFEVVVRGTQKRVAAVKTALAQYALGYRISNTKFAGWLAFLAEKLKAIKDELEKADPETRWKLVKDTVAKAAMEWREMDEAARAQYVERAQKNLKTYIDIINKSLETERELEKLINESMRAIEESVAEIVS